VVVLVPLLLLLLPLPPHPMACYENNRHESINAGMSLLTIIIVMANVLHTAGFKFDKSIALYIFRKFLYSNFV
jgi:hypothetical protein